MLRVNRYSLEYDDDLITDGCWYTTKDQFDSRFPGVYVWVL